MRPPVRLSSRLDWLRSAWAATMAVHYVIATMIKTLFALVLIGVIAYTVYLLVSGARKKAASAAASSSAAATTSAAASTTAAASGGQSGIEPGEIAGIAGGIVAALGIAVAVAIYIRRRRSPMLGKGRSDTVHSEGSQGFAADYGGKHIVPNSVKDTIAANKELDRLVKSRAARNDRSNSQGSGNSGGSRRSLRTSLGSDSIGSGSVHTYKSADV